ncbi:unnamed protein product [Sorangium cellulosum So ce56]|uniref:Sorangium cellulosum 'So ce 56' complete genome n=1 Tax=Sorangium cellulosum (strain So ce56) TaxID=448385 RepID=A9GUG5_SORC5|nr:hypothetical protein [Sorangium cellulosum]CAN90616.1 unnamed protein product [Sorangium cellulosum So ce56]
MTTVYEIRVAPVYVKSGALYLGPKIVRAGALTPGPVTVRVKGAPALSFSGLLNAGHGVRGLRQLHDALGLQAGQVLQIIVESPNVIVIVQTRTGPLQGRPIAGTRRSRGVKYKPLSAVHKEFIAAEICRLVRVARDAAHPSRRTARFLIDSLLWCWTADGIDDLGDAGRDKLKYDFDHQRHTRAAKELWISNGRRPTGLRHEHAVPRKELLRCLLESPQPRTEPETLEFLERLCFAVIVTKDEDAKFKGSLGDAMPGPWNCDATREQRFERYRAVGLRDDIVEP